MFNPKLIAIASGAGFVLSFVVGLFSKVHFGFVLLRAFIFAVVCGCISAAIMFIYNKFLSTSNDAESMSAGSPVGSLVDVTIGEDDLPDDDASPNFYVNKKKPKSEKVFSSFKASTIDVMTKKDDENVIAEGDDDSDIIDVASKTVEAKKDTAKKSAATEKKLEAKTSAASELDSELDELPSFDSLMPAEEDEEIEDAEQDMDDDEGTGSFSYSSATSSSKTAISMPSGEQDVASMAKAIQTVLKEDK